MMQAGPRLERQPRNWRGVTSRSKDNHKGGEREISEKSHFLGAVGRRLRLKKKKPEPRKKEEGLILRKEIHRKNLKKV